MTTRIEKDWEFNSGLFLSEKLILNSYKITCSMTVETEHIREQNIAMERLNFFIEEIIDSCIFLQKDDKIIPELKKLGIKICILPEEPYDQIIGMILLLKLNSILENRLIITDLIIQSKIGDEIKFNVIQEIAESFFSGNNWYNSTEICLMDIQKENDKKTKIVKLFSDQWAELGLSWKEVKQSTKKVDKS